MNFDEINKIVDPHIEELINQLKSNNIEVPITILKNLIISKVDEKLGRSFSSSKISRNEVAALYSGRGKAWAKVEVNEDCEIWNNINSILSVSCDHKDFVSYSSLLDIFKEKGFGWIRYGSSGKVFSTFKLRPKGSRSYEGINLKITNEQAIELENLCGVPQTLGLESGLNDFVNKKEVDKTVPDDLSNFGIMTIDQIISGENK